MDHVKQKQNQINSQIFGSYNPIESQSIEKADVDNLEKGKAAAIGEEREWGGKRYQKTATGWVPMGKGGSKGAKATEGSKSTSKKEIDEKTTAKPKGEGSSIEDHAVSTDDKDLQQFVDSHENNEELVDIAKKELDKRSNPFSRDKVEKADLSNNDYLEKGGKRAVIGEKRMFGGREYIKTASGWKFHGKGTGKKASEHRSGTESHGKDKSAKKNLSDLSKEEYDKAVHETATKIKQKVPKGGKKMYGLYEHDSFHSPFGKEKDSPIAAGRDKFIADVDKKISKLRKEESSSKHIGDMSDEEMKQHASKRGISTEGKTKAQIQTCVSHQ